MLALLHGVTVYIKFTISLCILLQIRNGQLFLGVGHFCDICPPFVMAFVLLPAIAGEGTCAAFLPATAKRKLQSLYLQVFWGMVYQWYTTGSHLVATG